MKIHQKEQVSFFFTSSRRGGKWTFQFGKNQFIRPDIRGVEQAMKVAAQISGAIKRTGGEIDKLAKGTIEKIIG